MNKRRDVLVDSSAEAQRFRLLARLRDGAVDTISARRDLNILMPAARIKELRKQGFQIETHRTKVFDDHGRPHARVAIYALSASPYTPIPSIEIRPQLYDAYYGTTPRCQPSSPPLPANTGNRVSDPVD